MVGRIAASIATKGVPQVIPDSKDGATHVTVRLGICVSGDERQVLFPGIIIVDDHSGSYRLKYQRSLTRTAYDKA